MRIKLACRRWVIWCFFTIPLALEASAADHLVPAEVQTIDCITYNGGVAPGDTIILAAGERDALRVLNCRGTAGSPITIRNDVTGNGPVILRRGTAREGEFIFHVRSSEFFVIDGTGGWKGSTGHCGWLNGQLGENCGIKITRIVAGDSPSSFLKFTGLFRNYTVKGVHIDGRYWGNNPLAFGNGSGIGIHQRSSEIASQNPGYWQENITYQNIYIHDIRTEGFYIGANHGASPDTPLRNILIQDNYIRTVGRDGIALKSAIGGKNIIRRNYIENSGLERTTNGGRGAIMAYETTHIAMYNNIVLDTFAWCLGVYTNLLPESYPLVEAGKYFRAENNLAVGCGSVGEEDRGHGIYVGANSGASVIEDIIIDYNTIVDSGPTTAISIGSRISGVGLKIRNNILATDKTERFISEKGLQVNNLTGRIDSFQFLNPSARNYRLGSESRAIGIGTAPYPGIDLDGLRRPTGSGPDVGAFEFVVLGARPNPPTIHVQ